MRGDSFAHVGIGFAAAEGAAGDAWAESEDRHMLAGVVGAGGGRVAAVVGGDDDEVAWSQPRLQLGRRWSKASSAAA